MNYESYTRINSQVRPEVTFVVARMSFGRRMELIRRIRDLTVKAEFLEAGETPTEKLDLALLSADVDRVYVIWGLQQLIGLEVDGAAATPELLASAGPEELFREAAAIVKAECGLSEQERKN
jgi:hypothetical protein